MVLRARIIRRCPTVAVSAILVVLVCCVAEGWGGSDLLGLIPALLLACLVLARRYPGERVLVALSQERRECWSRPRSSANARRSLVLVAVHGGLLIGRSLAVRPPPALPSAS